MRDGNWEWDLVMGFGKWDMEGEYSNAYILY